MKKLFLYTVIASGSLACTDKQVSETASVGLTLIQQPLVQVRKSLSDIPINSSTFCTPSFTRHCAREAVQLQQQLMELDPVPVPQLNVDPPVSATQADQLYRQFVTKQAGQPVLALFRQLYPRILLNKYGLITSANYSLATYYTRELVESGSYDFVTQANALKHIQAHIPLDQFNQLVQKAATTARLYQPQLKQTFAHKMASVNNPGVDIRFFPEDARKQISNHFIDEYRATNRAITQLEQLQAGQIN